MDMNYNPALCVHQWAQSAPDQLALSADGEEFSYADLAGAASRIAACLRASPAWSAQGTAPRVAILASRSAVACQGLLGACWAGAAYIPLNPTLPEARLVDLLRRCEVAALIADAEGARRLHGAVLDACPALLLTPEIPGLTKANGREVHMLQRRPAAAPDDAPAAMDAEALAYLIFTSGTTGMPKGVEIAAGSLRHYVEHIAALLGLRQDDRALEACELSFDFSVHNMFAPWQAGASVHVLPRSRTMAAVRFAREHRLTVWQGVPSLVAALSQIKSLVAGALPEVRLAVLGGEALPSAVVEAWRAAAPHSAIENLYGPTEATVFCLKQPVTVPTPLSPGRDFVAIGRPLPGCEAQVVDDAGAELPAGVPGELLVTGPQLARGYLGDPNLTSERFPTSADGRRWYRTGDLASRDAQGVFHWLGRMDNQVKVRGYRIELEEVDGALRTAASVPLAAAVAWPGSATAAQGLVGFVTVDEAELPAVMARLRELLPPHMLPSRLVALADMPLNSSGKVDRRALRERLDAGPI